MSLDHLSSGRDGLQPTDLALRILAQHRVNGGSTFSGRGENLLGKDAFAISIFPDITTEIGGTLGVDHIVAFLLKHAALLSHPHAESTPLG